MKRLGNWLVLFLKDERGAVMILVALLIVFVLIGMAALSVDVGYLYLQRRHLQNTADAAALAAAWELPWENSAITTTALLYAGHNNIDSNASDTSIAVTDPYGDRRKVKVEITKNYPLFFAFAPPIGQTNADVYAMAVATKRMPGMDLIPFVMLEYSDFLPEKYRYHDYPAGTTQPVYKIDLPGNLHPNENAFDLVAGEHAEWGDWGNVLADFHKVLCDFVTCGDIDVGKIVSIYKQGNQAGNWGIVDFRPFSDYQGNQQGHPNQESIQYVLNHGLSEPFCEDESKNRLARPGYVSAIDNANTADGITLTERLERDKDLGFYVILLLPGPASQFQGNIDNAFSIDSFLIGYFKTLVSTGQGNTSRLEGLLTDIIYCPELDPSSWHNRVMLIE